jgi:hypothetical protein
MWSPGSISSHNHVKILGIEIFVVRLVNRNTKRRGDTNADPIAAEINSV